MSDVLVDSSVWIDFLRGNAAAIKRVDPLLADGRAAIIGPVYAEVVSGAPDRPAFDRLATLFRSLDWLVPPAAVWEQIAEVRFALARQGTQAHLVDLLIAATALHARHSLLTRDGDFSLIARVLPVEVEVF
jgi:predicted nucleic acid-binding protein